MLQAIGSVQSGCNELVASDALPKLLPFLSQPACAGAVAGLILKLVTFAEPLRKSMSGNTATLKQLVGMLEGSDQRARATAASLLHILAADLTTRDAVAAAGILSGICAVLESTKLHGPALKEVFSTIKELVQSAEINEKQGAAAAAAVMKGVGPQPLTHPPALLLEAARALQGLVDSPLVQAQLSQPACVQVLFQLLASDMPVVRQAAQVLRSLSQNPANHSLLEAGWLRKLVGLLSQDDEALLLLAEDATLHFAAAGNQEVHLELSRLGCLSQLVRCLRRGNQQICLQALEILRHLSSLDELKLQMIAAGVVPVLVDILKAADAHCVPLALELLDGLVRVSTEVQSSLLTSCLVQSTEAHPPLLPIFLSSDAPNLAGLGAALCEALAAEGANAVELSAAGVMPGLVALQSPWRDQATVFALTTLVHLSTVEALHVTFAETGGLAAVCQLISNPQTSVQALALLCNVSYSVAVRHAVFDTGVASVVLPLIAQQQHDEEVAAYATALLQNLCLERALQPQLVQAGAVSVLAQCLTSASGALGEYACASLRWLAENEALQLTIGQAVTKPLVDLLQSDNVTVRHCCCWCRDMLLACEADHAAC